MNPQHTLSAVIRKALSERGINSLRAAADATGIPKDAIARRYRGTTPWTYPDDIEKVAAYLELPASELVARAERGAA